MLPVMKLFSVGDQVERGDYTVHSRFRRVVNFTNGRQLAFLVSREIGAGPLNIVVAAGFEQALAGVSSLRVEEDCLEVDDCRFDLKCLDRYQSNFTLAGWTPDRLGLNLELFRQLLAGESPADSLAFLIAPERIQNFTSAVGRAFVSRVRRGAEQVFGGSLMAGVFLLKGCGAGLTPSGDDFIAGVLIGLHFIQQARQRELGEVIDAIFRAATGNNVFSNTFLDLAAKGRVFGKMKNLLMAVRGEDSDVLRVAVRSLFAVGATSGADLGTGFLMTLLDEKGAVPRWMSEVAALRSAGKVRDETAFAKAISSEG
jgi:hypothetical protein